MSSSGLTVMYGHLEGEGRGFARDPSGYLSIENGIFRKHGLDVSWIHVQGTEERYRRLKDGSAQISLVVGRASLQHFMTSGDTRILGAVMNSCPYYLMAAPAVRSVAGLKGKTLACREAPARNTPIAETLYDCARLRVGADLVLQLPRGDHEAFDLLIRGEVHAALLPRPFGFLAEEKGFTRIAEWPDVVDDPLPITIETTRELAAKRINDFAQFLAAHREGIGFFKSHRREAIGVLEKRFGHAGAMAEKIFTDYATCMDETLKVDFQQFKRLLAQVAPSATADAKRLASEWIAPGAMKNVGA